jgi:hypothetical protein
MLGDLCEGDLYSFGQVCDVAVFGVAHRASKRDEFCDLGFKVGCEMFSGHVQLRASFQFNDGG